MIDLLHLLSLLILGQATLFILFVCIVQGHAAYDVRRRRREAYLWDRAREDILAAMAGRGGKDGLAWLDRHPVKDRARILDRLGDRFRGAAQGHVSDIGVQLGVADAARRWMASGAWWRRARALRILGHLGAEPGAARHALGDEHPIVRRQALAWVARHGDERAIEAVLARWPKMAFGERQAAKDALARRGALAADAVARHLDEHGPDADLLDVAAAVPTGDFAPAVRAAIRHSSPAVRAAGVRLSGYVHHDEPGMWPRLLQDRDENVRLAAIEALATRRGPEAPRSIEGRLRDDSWRVRLAAAEALANLGAEGLLRLRVCADSDGPGSAAAGHVLVLKEATA